MATHINKIIVPVDTSSNSTMALKAALSLALAYKASLYVHHVSEETSSDEVKQKVASVLGSTPHTYSESKGSVYKEIIIKSLDVNADLIVMGTHGNTGFQEFWLGSNANKVVSSAKCPVLTIRNDARSTDFKNIVVPMDTSFESRQKVPAAIDLALALKGSIHILGVSTSKDKEAEHIVGNYSRQASDSISDHNIPCTIEKRLGGNITNTTIAYAEEIKADLIVIMTEQEPQIGSFFLGKFAQQMVNNSPVPVICVPTREDLMITDARL
ncbi:MAG: universal stress protein [Bacteroidia bacterium]|nr:universal stress protein [Bacteroidia bacterium]MBP9689677.1 universal stress protein [Bacteroidia bacterium]